MSEEEVRANLERYRIFLRRVGRDPRYWWEVIKLKVLVWLGRS